jgi:hypothetical protein
VKQYKKRAKSSALDPYGFKSTTQTTRLEINLKIAQYPRRYRKPKTVNSQTLKVVARTLAPFMLAMVVSSAAHAQGTIDMSGATTLMTTVKTFAEYAGAVICLISLIFAGVQMMSGNFARAIPALGGAIFGAGVLGWGAGWISSLTGQSVSMIVTAHSQWLA